MGTRIMVVQARTRLPAMAKPHFWVGILPGSLSRLYKGNASCKHVGAFTPLSNHHRLP
jgi:hypothetical protein